MPPPLPPRTLRPSTGCPVETPFWRSSCPAHAAPARGCAPSRRAPRAHSWPHVCRVLACRSLTGVRHSLSSCRCLRTTRLAAGSREIPTTRASAGAAAVRPCCARVRARCSDLVSVTDRHRRSMTRARAELFEPACRAVGRLPGRLTSARGAAWPWRDAPRERGSDSHESGVRTPLFPKFGASREKTKAGKSSARARRGEQVSHDDRGGEPDEEARGGQADPQH